GSCSAPPRLLLQESDGRRGARFLQAVCVAGAIHTQNMKLAFSTNAYLKFSFSEAVRRLAAIGYAGVEIMADVPHAWPACLLEEQKEAIRRSLRQHRLAVSNINAFMMNAISDVRQRYWHPSWIEPDRHYRQIRIEHTIRSLTLARELGAPCITPEPGGPGGSGESWAAAGRPFVEMLKPGQ